MNELFKLTSTFADIGGWPGALMVAACGLVVVFIVLAVLALMIMVISKVVGLIEGSKSTVDSVSKAAASAPKAAAPAKEEDDEELIAVLTAAVAAAMGTTPDTTRLTRIIRY